MANIFVNSIDKSNKNNIVNKILYDTEASKMLVYNEENNIEKSNENRLTIFIPGKDQTIDNLSKDNTLNTINKLVPGDIMLLDYHRNRTNSKYKPDISKIDDFFRYFYEEIKREKLTDKINNKNEIIIIGYSLGCLYANLLVDYLKENFFKSKNNIRISLILLKPFVNIGNCVNTLLKENTGFLTIDNIGDDLIKKTSNDKILNNRLNKCKNNRVSFIDSTHYGHSLYLDEISQWLNEYLKITSQPYGCDKYNYKYDTTIILTSQEDEVVGNEIKNKIKHINKNNIYNRNIKNQNINSNFKKNNIIINDKSILKTREMINYAIINRPYGSSINKIAKENFVFDHIEGEAEEEKMYKDYTDIDKELGIINEVLTKKQNKENKEDKKSPNKEDKKSPNKKDNKSPNKKDNKSPNKEDKKSPNKVKNNTLVIFVTGEIKTIDDQKGIIKQIRKDINSDILLLDYHKSEENKDYSPDIFNIEGFFKIFESWLTENPKIKNKIKNKKEIIIIGHSLGALYANRLVDHLRNGILKDKTDILIHLILIKPFSDINSCVNTLLKEVTQGINCTGINDKLNKKTSNVEIIKKRQESKNGKYSINGLVHDLPDYDIVSSSIDEYIYLKNNSKCCSNIILITSDNKDYVSGNDIIKQLVKEKLIV